MVLSGVVLLSVVAAWRGRAWKPLLALGGGVVFCLVVASFLETTSRGSEVPWDAGALGGDVLLSAPVPHSPEDLTLGRRLKEPSAWHILGTDRLGRDVLSSVLHGLRVSLLVGFGSVLIAAFVGVLLGATAAYRGGLADDLLSGLMQVLSAFPGLLLLLLVFLALEPRVGSMILVLAAMGWVTPARLIRTEVMRLRHAPHVELARTIGISSVRILRVYVLPYALPPVQVHASLAVAGAILLESTLSFLGLSGADHISLGILLRDGRESLPDGKHLILFPGFVLLALVLSLHSLADRLGPRLAPTDAEEALL
jgi:peptide/nickel transport system permease protein